MTAQILNGRFSQFQLGRAPLSGRGLGGSLLAVLALGAVPAGAATIIVSGTCTLAEAISSANKDTSYTGPCVQGSGDDTISLTDTIVLSATPTAIASNVILEGNNKTLDGNNSVRILSISSGVVTIKNITITRGNASDSAGGGAIYKNGGDLTINDSSFVANKTTGTGTPGGAINNTVGSLALNRSQFMGNAAASSGGAVSSSGPLEINKCTFGYDTGTSLSNKANVYGGAVQVSNSVLNIYDSTFDRNAGNAGGGAVYVGAGSGFNISGTISNSTFIRNQTSFVTTDADGGAIFLEPVNGGSINTTFTYNTIVRNRAFNGGGIHTHVNTTVTLHGNLIAGNTFYAGTGEGDGCVSIKGASNCANEVLNLGNSITTSNNLLGRDIETIAQALIGYTPDSTDICATSNAGVNCISKPTSLASMIMIPDILQPPAEWNGGPTQTVALVEGSNNPAIDAIATGGSAPSCSGTETKTLDQRGYKRANGNGYTKPGANPNQCNTPYSGYGNDKCDIGAYEFIAQNVCTLESYQIKSAGYYEDNRSSPVADTSCTPGTPNNLRYGRYRITTDWTPTINMKNVVFKVRRLESKIGTVPSNYMVNFNAYQPAVTPVPRVGSTQAVAGTKTANIPFTTTFDIARCSTSGFYFYVDMFADPTVQTGYGAMTMSAAADSQPKGEKIKGQMRIYVDEKGKITHLDKKAD